ncbi:MAG: LysR family transcriptional regulator [Lachnospiraceae bacterium]|nr:LysR family transcriptional regulator [Lachnospiraceae bacterium]
MNLKTLEYFVAVAEELNISKAAKRLNMSQPPLSTQIKALEYELNTTLFIRGKRALQLTESGQLLYRRAKEIISLSDKARSEILSMSKGMGGTISIGLVEGMAHGIAAGWFSGFIKDYPGVRFRILGGNSDDLTEKLRSGMISFAVITAPCNQALLNSFVVGSEKMTALMDREHPLAKRDEETIEISDLIGASLIVPGRKATIDMIYKWFRVYRAEPNIVCETDSYLDAAALVRKGLGTGIFPRSTNNPNRSLVIKELSGSDKNIEYLFVWRKGHPLPSVEEAFIDHVKNSVDRSV